MEQAVISQFSSEAHHATPTLPSDLDYFFVVNEHGHRALPAGKGTHPFTGRCVGLDVVFDKFGAAPLEPFAHLFVYAGIPLNRKAQV